MRLSQHWTILLSSPLLILLTGRASFAFSFTMPSQQPNPICTPTSPYCSSISQTKPGVGTLTVSTTPVSVLPLGGTNDFFNLLTSSVWAQNGWTFNKAQPVESLTGRFDIGVYAPSIFLTTPERIGAEIQVLYNPGAGFDPVGSNVHFIQRVVNNHANTITLQGAIQQPPGTPDDKIDTVLEQTQLGFIDPRNPQKPTFNPFYDTYGQVVRYPNQTILFVDIVAREDIYYNNKNWSAELYLAEVKDPINNPNEVTIYNGISWGWESIFTPPKTSKKFSDSLASGFEVDRFNLSDLTPGSKYIAWTNNDLPSNRCNPNTFLSTHNNSGFRLGFDDNSSSVGNGFASALTGTVGSSGNINLDVRAAGGGARGQNTGNYELFVDVYDPQDSPDFSSASSGGGGFGKEMRGLTQQNPILPNSIQNGWQVFNKVPGCRWFDPPTTYGFEFQSLEDTLFTEILDFPAGDDQQFTVAVGDSILGNFSPGDKLDFVSLLGYPVDNFRITGIDSLFGETAETAFPIQLAFQEREGSFKMRQIPKPIDAEAVPEPGSILATKGMLLWFGAMRHILRKKRQAG